MLSLLSWLNVFIIFLDLQVLNKLHINANAVVLSNFKYYDSCFICQEIQQNLFYGYKLRNVYCNY